MTRDADARAAYLSEVREAFGQSGQIIPQLASMVLPKVAELVREHVRTTPPPVSSKDTTLPGPSLLAPATPAPDSCSDLAGAGDDWPLRDICSGCGAEFSIEFRGPKGCCG